MDERPQRRITFTDSAELDLAEIYTFSALRFGIEQAQNYIAFLRNGIEMAASGEKYGVPVPDREDVYRVMLRWPKAKHGHNVIFRRTYEELVILRILHTARDD